MKTPSQGDNLAKAFESWRATAAAMSHSEHLLHVAVNRMVMYKAEQALITWMCEAARRHSQQHLLYQAVERITQAQVRLNAFHYLRETDT